jgi:uncharacterized protein YqgC (DUF456 family)
MSIGPYSLYLDAIIRAVALTVMLVGLVVLPLLPGLVIIWVAALGFGLVVGFNTIGWIIFVILTILMLAGSIVDNILMGTQAHKEGAPWWAILLAMLAAFLGTFLIPIPIIGGILAAVLTLFGIEWYRRKDWKKALLSLKGMLIGWGWAFGIRFIIGLVMIGLWLIWATI